MEHFRFVVIQLLAAPTSPSPIEVRITGNTEVLQWEKFDVSLLTAEMGAAIPGNAGKGIATLSGCDRT
jgi:hypothetical protein